MPAEAVLGLAVFVVFNLVVGVRLFRLAARDRSLPELALAVGFTFSGGVGAALQVVSPLELGPEAFQALSFAGVRLSLDLGLLCQAFFTWRVFRREQRWAAALFTAVALGLSIVWLGYASEGVLADRHYRGLWFWLEIPLHASCVAWGAFEALTYYTSLRRRLALGLADPIVVNRMLLWGIGLASGTLALLVPPTYFLLRGGGSSGGVVVGLSAVLGLVATGCYALTFFPPRAYLRRLTARGA